MIPRNEVLVQTSIAVASAEVTPDQEKRHDLAQVISVYTGLIDLQNEIENAAPRLRELERKMLFACKEAGVHILLLP